jgi:hypothetical protein
MGAVQWPSLGLDCRWWPEWRVMPMSAAERSAVAPVVPVFAPEGAAAGPGGTGDRGGGCAPSPPESKRSSSSDGGGPGPSKSSTPPSSGGQDRGSSGPAPRTATPAQSGRARQDAPAAAHPSAARPVGPARDSVAPTRWTPEPIAADRAPWPAPKASPGVLPTDPRGAGAARRLPPGAPLVLRRRRWVVGQAGGAGAVALIEDAQPPRAQRSTAHGSRARNGRGRATVEGARVEGATVEGATAEGAAGAGRRGYGARAAGNGEGRGGREQCDVHFHHAEGVEPAGLRRSPRPCRRV